MAKALAPQDDHAAAPAVEVESTVVALVDFAGGGAAAGGVAAGGEVVVVVVATSVAAWVARAAEKGATVLAAADERWSSSAWVGSCHVVASPVGIVA